MEKKMQLFQLHLVWCIWLGRVKRWSAANVFMEKVNQTPVSSKLEALHFTPQILASCKILFPSFPNVQCCFPGPRHRKIHKDSLLWPFVYTSHFPSDIFTSILLLVNLTLTVLSNRSSIHSNSLYSLQGKTAGWREYSITYAKIQKCLIFIELDTFQVKDWNRTLHFGEKSYGFDYEIFVHAVFSLPSKEAFA